MMGHSYRVNRREDAEQWLHWSVITVIMEWFVEAGLFLALSSSDEQRAEGQN